MLFKLAIALTATVVTPVQKKQPQKTQIIYVKDVTDIRNPPADAPSIKYILRKVLQKKKVSTPASSPLSADKKWTLVEMNGKKLSKSLIWMQFDPATNQYHGHGGCNGLGGAYTSKGNSITMKMGMSTMMACPDQQDMQNETSFHKAIGDRTYTYKVVDETLNFYQGKKIVLSFKQDAAQPDQWAFIASKKWALIKMGNSTYNDSRTWLEFDTRAGRYFGKGGCNNVSGAYKAIKNTITFNMGATTRMACPDPSITRREQEFLHAISQQTFRYDVADQTLNLYKNGKLVMIFGMQEKEQ